LRKLAQEWSLSGFSEQGGAGTGYRHRVRLSVRGVAGKVGIGIFEKGSHRLVSIPTCPVHHGLIENLLGELERELNASGISPYDEAAHRGTLRAVQIAVSPLNQKVQLVFVVNHELDDPALNAFRRFLAAPKWGELTDGVFLNAQPRRSNTLLGAEFELLSGSDMYRDSCAGADVYYPPDAFGQANPVLHEHAVRKIQAEVGEGDSVFEFYAGVGTIGLGLVKKGHSVSFNELGAGSLRGLHRSLSELGSGAGPHQIHEGKAGEFAGLYDTEQIVVVDPPRKGLDPLLLERFVSQPPKKLLYLSCGIESLLRESEELKAAGKLRLRELAAFAYFPFTDHVETLAIFERAR